MNTPIEIDATIIARPINRTALTYADNPQPRCPVVLLLDCSSSMAGQAIAELNEGLRQFLSELSSDPIASMSVELAVIGFGEQVELLNQFQLVSEAARNPVRTLHANGYTPLGAAMRLGLAEIRQRRAFYSRQGVSAFRPWMVILTDGQPNDDWITPAAEARSLAEKGRLNLLGVGIGSDADMRTLGTIVPADPGPQRLVGLQFAAFFRWLSDSLRLTTSGSTVDNRKAPNPSSYGWNI